MPTVKILGSQRAFEGRAFAVDLVRLGMPDGRERIFDLVSHPDSISILPLDQDGCILFVSQFRLGARGDLLELPAGVLEEDEDPEGAAQRELREETGLAAGRMVKLGAAYLAPGYASELMHFFLALELTPAPLHPDSDEFLSLVRIPAIEAYRMARAGEIHDSKSLAGLLLAENSIK